MHRYNLRKRKHVSSKRSEKRRRKKQPTHPEKDAICESFASVLNEQEDFIPETVIDEIWALSKPGMRCAVRWKHLSGGLKTGNARYGPCPNLIHAHEETALPESHIKRFNGKIILAKCNSCGRIEKENCPNCGEVDEYDKLRISRTHVTYESRCACGHVFWSDW